MAISTLIVGVMLVAALNTVVASKVSQTKSTDHYKGLILAAGLLNEILSLSYWDPHSQAGLGAGGAEAATGNRSLFDDVDDYIRWSASPPQKKDGTVIPGLDEWTRRVDVDWVNPVDLDRPVSSETYTKRITVTVERNGRVTATLVTIRTQAWPDPVIK